MLTGTSKKLQIQQTLQDLKKVIGNIAELSEPEFNETIELWHEVVDELKDVVFDSRNGQSRLKYEFGWGAQSIQFAIDCIPHFHRILKRYYRRQDDLSFLDVGGGSGAGANVFAQLHSDRVVYSKIKIDVIDYVPLRKRWVQSVYPNLNYSVRDVYDLADQQWDFVFCSHVIEHVPNPRKFCQQLIKICKGFAFIYAPYNEIELISCHINTITEELFQGFNLESLEIFKSMAWHADKPKDNCILAIINCQDL